MTSKRRRKGKRNTELIDSTEEVSKEEQNAEHIAAREAKKAISLTIRPSLLKMVDSTAIKLGISRAAFFSIAASRMIGDEEDR